MPNLVLVPIELDALPLEKGQTVVGANARFTGVPYFAFDDQEEVQAHRDFNSSRPNLFSQIDAEAFNSANLYLPEGVHLHWALPDALARGTHLHGAAPDGSEDDIIFPAAPNRWLIIRSNSSDGATWTTKRTWVVESDFISTKIGETGHGILSATYPVTDNDPSGHGRPWRYLGRKLELVTANPDPDFNKVTAWTEAAASSYLPSLGETLTANGYGDPTFDAFYPNCVGVFGMHDDRIAPESFHTRYEIFGWYSDLDQDPFNQFITDFEQKSDAEIRSTLNRHATSEGTALLRSTDALGAAHYTAAFGLYVQERFRWALEDTAYQVRVDGAGTARTLHVETTAGAQLEGIFCHSRLVLENGGNEPSVSLEPISSPVMVGNTGTEALSSWLAKELPSENTLSVTRKQIEEQLEALNLTAAIQGENVDLGQRFREARHTAGFKPVAGETFWTLRPAQQSAVRPGEQADVKQDDVVYPQALSNALSDLNETQRAYDLAGFSLQSIRQNLFSNWHRYMRALYVEADEDAEIRGHIADEIQQHIRTIDLPALNKARDQRGKIQISQDPATRSAQATLLEGSVDSLAAEIINRLNVLIVELAAFNQQRETDNKSAFRLQRTPGPRYYQPNDPVVLLVDPIVEATMRHGQDGRLNGGFLNCLIQDLPFNRSSANASSLVPLQTQLDTMAPSGTEAIGFETQTNRPWNPILMEWEALVDPLTPADFGGSANEKLEPGFIRNNPDLAITVLDQNHFPRTVDGEDPAFRPLRGRTILSPHPTKLLKQRLKAYIERQETDNAADEAFNTAQLALSKLEAANFHALAQSVGGFNRALLMHRPSEQLLAGDPFGAADPAGFDSYRDFAKTVRDALQGTDRLDTPEPAYHFNPLRTGDMILKRLRVVDTFGQKVEWIPSEALTTPSLDAGSADRIGLPVRITQPARLNFRWLKAEDDRQESSSSADTTPICGWFLANHLDRSVMIYNTTGSLLGYIDQAARWRQLPGSDTGPVQPSDISNRHLRRLVQWIVDQREGNPNIVEEFISMLETVLPSIEPENFAQHHAQSLFIGRPIALLRAKLNLELREKPALDVSDEQFERQLNGHPPSDHGFTKVEFPIRIGELRQFNDSVISYWLEEDGKLVTLTPDEVLATPDTRDDLQVWRPTIWQSLAEAPQTISLLMDPRGCAHATTGILPTKAITIPADQYAGILSAIQVTFLSAPILTPPDQTQMPIPALPGFSWEWLQKDGTEWTTVPAIATIDRSAILKAFPETGATIWTRMDEQNWIRIDASGNRAALLAPEGDSRLSLGEDLARLEPDILRVIDESARAIRPVKYDAHFAPPVELREGWLSMRLASDNAP